nr:putative transcription factor interactor and regulator CCHC(Zn) family [Ipomoea batatas]
MTENIPSSSIIPHEPRIIVQDNTPFPSGIILDDTNYPLWSQLMEMRIGARNKSGFLTGTILKPTANDKQLETWLIDNNREIDARVQTKENNAEVFISLHKHMTRLQVHIFLAGLDPEFNQARSEILRKDPPLDLESCYAYVRATGHMTNDSTHLSSIRSSTQPHILTANGGVPLVTGEGPMHVSNSINLDTGEKIVNLGEDNTHEFLKEQAKIDLQPDVDTCLEIINETLENEDNTTPHPEIINGSLENQDSTTSQGTPTTMEIPNVSPQVTSFPSSPNVSPQLRRNIPSRIIPPLIAYQNRMLLL